MALSPFYTYRQMNVIGCPPIADAAVLGSMLSLGKSSLCADTVMRVNIQEICCRAEVDNSGGPTGGELTDRVVGGALNP